jgi:hypothetical protein
LQDGYVWQEVVFDSRVRWQGKRGREEERIEINRKKKIKWKIKSRESEREET